MFRFFEKLVDPYQPYPVRNRPPRALLLFLREYLRPFKKIFGFSIFFQSVVATVQIFLIWYFGRLVVLMTETTPSEFWDNHWVELALVTGFILLIRPLIETLSTLLLNNTILPNVGTLVRYRAHRHVLGQSVGWFENDFAGRIANRIMQTPPATGEFVYQLIDAVTYSFVYLMTGRVVDSYTNIHAVKMFSQNDQELAYGVEAIEEARVTFQKEMRLYTTMEFGLGCQRCGLGCLPVEYRQRRCGLGCRWCSAYPADERHVSLDHVGIDHAFQRNGCDPRGDGNNFCSG